MKHQNPLVVTFLLSMVLATFGCSPSKIQSETETLQKGTDGETSANQSTFDKSTSDQTDQNYSQDFDINRIVALINRAQNARKEKLEPFEAQTKLRMERIHKERAFQQAVESQARGASLDRIREMVPN